MRKLVFSGLLVLSLCASAQIQTAPSTSTPGSSPARLSPGQSACQTPALPADELKALTLPPQGLLTEKPIPGEIITAPAYTRELIRVQWRFGDPIDLYVIRPIGVAKPPVVLFLYSFPSENDRFRSDKFCSLVTKNGDAAVGFVSALTGQRYHDRPMKEWFVSQLPEALITSVQDVQMILNYLAARGDFDMERVGIFGQGSGGTIAVLSAAADMRIKAVDVMDPWGDWRVWLAESSQIPDDERSAYLTPEFLSSVAPLDPLHWLPRLAQPVRVQEALFNQAMPAEVHDKMKAAVAKANGTEVEYPSVETYKSQVVQGATMLTWLHSHLLASAISRGCLTKSAPCRDM